MHVPWVDRLTFIGWLAVLAITAFFSFRYVIRFGRQVKLNRAAGLYDAPEFKRRIKPLNIWRYGLVAAMLLEGVAAIWASLMGVAPRVYWTVFLIFLVPISIWAEVLERRWRRLMTKGIEYGPSD